MEPPDNSCRIRSLAYREARTLSTQGRTTCTTTGILAACHDYVRTYELCTESYAVHCDTHVVQRGVTVCGMENCRSGFPTVRITIPGVWNGKLLSTPHQWISVVCGIGNGKFAFHSILPVWNSRGMLLNLYRIMLGAL